MNGFRLRIAALIFLFCIIGLPSQILAQSGVWQLRLEGLELAKGIDITDTFRIGTIFAGEVFEDGSKIGCWTAILSHRGTENIEVCKGFGDIVTMRLTINFNWGDQLVLGMRDRSRIPDVFWDYNYAGPPCSLGGFGCQSCGDAAVSDCDRGGSSNLAWVEDINLTKRRGSTINISSAVLEDGRLCHYYPLIPRVFAWLILVGP